MQGKPQSSDPAGPSNRLHPPWALRCVFGLGPSPVFEDMDPSGTDGPVVGNRHALACVRNRIVHQCIFPLYGRIQPPYCASDPTQSPSRMACWICLISCFAVIPSACDPGVVFAQTRNHFTARSSASRLRAIATTRTGIGLARSASQSRRSLVDPARQEIPVDPEGVKAIDLFPLGGEPCQGLEIPGRNRRRATAAR